MDGWVTKQKENDPVEMPACIAGRNMVYDEWLEWVVQTRAQ